MTDEPIQGHPRADWLRPVSDGYTVHLPAAVAPGPLSDDQVEELKAAMRSRKPMIVVPNETPGYVHRLLDAFIDGSALDFAGLDVPDDVQGRLAKAYGHEPAHQQEASENSRKFQRDQLVRASVPAAIEQKIRAGSKPMGEILKRREDIMPMGDVDRSLLETALDYIERDQIEIAREHLAAMTNGGLARAISDIQVLQVMLAGSVFSLINSGLRQTEADSIKQTP